MFIIQHFPILQALIPFITALLCALISKYNIARIATIISISINSLISFYCFFILAEPVSYELGNWQVPIGIEYRLDKINQPIIIYINLILLFFLVFAHPLIEESITKFIEVNRRHLFYSILLFAHSGYIGILSTNDLFNLYVFIEISSLSAYVLMSQGSNPRAVIGAFDYLMLGSIGATLILIGIGFLLSITGSLNITDIKTILVNYYSSKITFAAISFIIIGCLLKIAFFPMCFWMIRSYDFVSSTILIYIAAISTIMGGYICLRFIYFTIEYQYVASYIIQFLRPLILTSIILPSLLAILTTNIKKIIIYSSVAQIGYVVLVLMINSNKIEPVSYQLLFIDGLNKTALFFIMSYNEYYKMNPITTRNKILISLILIFSSGLPLSPMFIVKLNILDMLISYDKWLEFIAIIISSAFALLYHYKIADILFFKQENDETAHNKSDKNYDPFKALLMFVISQITALLLI